jgi:hypothetical protein
MTSDHLPRREQATREQATRERLADVVSAAFGPGRGLRSLSRLPGASKKGVYRAICDSARTTGTWPRPTLTPARLALFRLAMHLSLVAGPLRLLDGDYPEREEMLEIAESNLAEVLAEAGRAR